MDPAAFDFSVETPPAVEAVSLSEGVNFDSRAYEQLVEALQRAGTPELSEACMSFLFRACVWIWTDRFVASSPAASPAGMTPSPAPGYPQTLDFSNTYSDGQSRSSLFSFPHNLTFHSQTASNPIIPTHEPLIFDTNYFNIAFDPFSTLMQPASGFDMSLPDILSENSWMGSCHQQDLNSWMLPSSVGGVGGHGHGNGHEQSEKQMKMLRAQVLREELRKLEQEI